MNVVKFVSYSPSSGRGRLLINGQHVDGVVSVEPNLFDCFRGATVTIVLQVKEFTYEPDPTPEAKS